MLTTMFFLMILCGLELGLTYLAVQLEDKK